MKNLIAQLEAACKANKMTVERTTKPAPASANSINILTETFDLIDSEDQWKGTLTLYPNGAISIEKGGRFNWTDRFASIFNFKKAMRNKKIA